MARPRGFDPDAAVQTAMMLFWRRGYGAVSFDMLVDEIGASRKGLYALWPDKRGLFVAALRSYRQIVGDVFLRDLEREGAGRAELAAFWDKFESAAQRPGWSGCLVMRTTTDRIAAEPDVAIEIEAYLERLSNGLENALRGAARRAEIPSEPSAHIRACQAFAAVTACSAIGSFEGFSPRCRGMTEAGRAACGAPLRAPAAQSSRRTSKPP